MSENYDTDQNIQVHIRSEHKVSHEWPRVNVPGLMFDLLCVSAWMMPVLCLLAASAGAAYQFFMWTSGLIYR
jgi:hypothetical protein